MRFIQLYEYLLGPVCPKTAGSEFAFVPMRSWYTRELIASRGCLFANAQEAPRDLASLARTEPANTTCDVVEGEMKKFSHPVPVSSSLHKAGSNGKVARSFRPFVITCCPGRPIVPSDRPCALQSMSHTPCKHCANVVVCVRRYGPVWKTKQRDPHSTISA